MYYRAFFSLPTSIVDIHGKPANAVRGTLNAISSIASLYRPRRILATIDASWRPQWRVDLLPEYKSHRLAADNQSEITPDELTAQIPKLIELLKAMSIKVVEQVNYEADDCIASIVNVESNCLVVTSDRDLFQLISKERDISLYLQSDKKEPLWDYERFLSIYNFEPAQYLDFAVLRGDPSDGLRGIEKIGEKTASRMIIEYKNIDNLKQAIKKKSIEKLSLAEKNLLAAEDYLKKALKVSGLVQDLKFDLSKSSKDSLKIEFLSKNLRVEKPVNEILRLIHD